MAKSKITTSQVLRVDAENVLSFKKSKNFPDAQLFYSFQSEERPGDWAPRNRWSGRNMNPLRGPADYAADYVTKAFGLSVKNLKNGASVSLTETGAALGVIGQPEVPPGGGLLIVRSGIGIDPISQSSAVSLTGGEQSQVKGFWACGALGTPVGPVEIIDEPGIYNTAAIPANLTATIAMTSRLGERLKFTGVSRSVKNALSRAVVINDMTADGLTPLALHDDQVGQRPAIAIFFRPLSGNSDTNECPVDVIASNLNPDEEGDWTPYPLFRAASGDHGFRLYGGDCLVMQFGKQMDVIEAEGDTSPCISLRLDTELSGENLPRLTYALITTP